MVLVDDAIHEFCTLQKAWLETELHAGENEERTAFIRQAQRLAKLQ
jgi:hypothetical protein